MFSILFPMETLLSEQRHLRRGLSSFPVFEKDVLLILITDASNHGMGAVLKQIVKR